MLFRVSPVFAEAPYIAVYPPHVPNVSPPSTFTIKINISCTVGFVGYQFYLYWNRTYINATGMTETPPAAWNPYYAGDGLDWDYNETHGRIERAVIDTHIPLVPVTGDFTVATITFKVLEFSSPPTVVLLDLIEEDTFLADKNGNMITPYYVYDGDVTIGYDNVPPEIVSVEWKPTCPYPYVPSETPRTNEPVLVTANVTEPVNASGVAEVLFSYRTDGNEWWNTTMVYNMTSSLWTTIIPGQLGDTIIKFFIRAYDKAGNMNTSPMYTFYVKKLPTGDLNGDNIVNVLDLVRVAIHYGETGP